MDLKELIEECEDQLNEYALERLDECDPDDIAEAISSGDIEDMNELIEVDSDIVHSIADGTTPIYHSDLLDVAMSSIGSIATVEPELGPAFDGRPTPTNIIAANIYEALCEAMWEYISSDEWKEHFDTYCENNKIVLDVGGPSYANYHRVKGGK